MHQGPQQVALPLGLLGDIKTELFQLLCVFKINLEFHSIKLFLILDACYFHVLYFSNPLSSV